ncbi:MAG: helix-turn-helix domain-containing protein [Bacteroidetes bacterium]|nr:helix-turn-helix domain-containing protein [Bacteroidota bacterium]
MELKKRLLLFLMSFLCIYTYAQYNQFQFSRLDITQGLSQNEVNCIFKDSKGFLWFGTMTGLNRYDGYEFKVFRNDLNDSLSLSDNYISQIFEGPENKLWIFTKTGLNIYDPATEKFYRNPKPFLKALNIPDLNISSIIKDGNGNYWFAHRTNGLYKYTTSTHAVTHFYKKQNNADALYSDSVSSLATGPNGSLWVIYNDAVVDKIDDESNRIVYRNFYICKLFSSRQADYHLFADAQNQLWVYVLGNNPIGVIYFDPSTGSLKHIEKKDNGIGLNTNLVNGVVQDESGLIWIATDHGGINLLDKKDFSIRYLLNREDDEKSISQNSIISLYKDNSGIIWIGTFKKGISYYHGHINKFPLYKKLLSNPSSLSYNDVNRFVEDAKGNLWIGTNGGGLIYFNRLEGRFTQYKHNASDAQSLCNDVVVSLWIDHDQKLWIGTYFGGLDCFDGKKFIHYKHNDADPASIGDNRIWEIFEDSQQRLWIGTFDAGVELYDRKKNNFIHYRPFITSNPLRSRYIDAFAEDAKGNLWIGTSTGIDVLDKQLQKFIHYGLDPANPSKSISNDNVICLLNDKRGWMWIGTRDGLNILDPSTKKIKTLRASDGLPDNTILTMLEEDNHHIWLSTPNGLCDITVGTDKKTGELIFQFQNYDENDGLQGREFNENAALKTKAGELIFGGANGFNLFNAQNIVNNNQQASVILTGLQMFNKDVAIGEKLNGHIVLEKSITESKEITLRHNENVFSIEFAALDFPAKKKIRYAYMLEGFSNDWLVADGKTRKATFTNLDPGNYTFRVKTSREDGSWGNEATVLAIKILPPFWKTPVAYFIYAVLIISGLFFARRVILQRAKMRFAIEHERKEAQRLHELDMMKIKFFTNVSHEFRTPLSLILSPLDKIIKDTSEQHQKNQFQLIHRNARRLLNLVNQLLDFRKMEVQELKLHATKGDVAKFIKDISYSFTDLAEKKNIQFNYKSAVASFITKFDHDKIERILFNLLSNAFKFTHEHGNVDMQVEAQQTNDDDTSLFIIKIKDTGIGIPAEKQEKIFERFFQNEVPGEMMNQGSGIGLSITKEFVKLHGGAISVESEVDKGSTFIVTIPFKESRINIPEILLQEEDAKIKNTDDEHEEPVVQQAVKNKDTKNKKPVILLVEDNEDFRFYLKDNLRQFFSIEEAANGKEGWQRALAVHPELIVSDISMPVMDGIDFCKKVKADKRTSFIPVILLTALMGDEQQLKGLETGASDYITKPFNFEILLSKIKNLLGQQAKAKQTFQKQVQVSPSEIKTESADEKFIRQALALVEENMSNDRFSVEEMSRDLFMSRVALYKKILSLTGKTPVEFIRSIRLKRAAQLLEKSTLTISEIAYDVGFNNPKYFSKYFKEEYGMLPSAYQAQKKKEDIK